MEERSPVSTRKARREFWMPSVGLEVQGAERYFPAHEDEPALPEIAANWMELLPV